MMRPDYEVNRHTEQCSARLPKWAANRIRQVAAERGWSFAEAMRTVIVDRLKQLREENR
jgi:hypothetical protein